MSSDNIDGTYPTYDPYFSPDILRTYCIALADRFNQIKVRRFADNFIDVVKVIPVGLNLNIPTKMHLERTEDFTSEGGNRYYQTEPFMNLKFDSMDHDPSRNKGINETRTLYVGEFNKIDKINGTNVIDDLSPVPYNYNFTLSIRTKHYEDVWQILEQILPYFNDDNYLRVREFPFLNIDRDIRIKLTSNSPDIPDQMSEEEGRQVYWTLGFVLEGWLYRPIKQTLFLKKIGLIVNSQPEDTEIVELDRQVELGGVPLVEHSTTDSTTIPAGSWNIYYSNGKFYYSTIADGYSIPTNAYDIKLKSDNKYVLYTKPVYPVEN